MVYFKERALAWTVPTLRVGMLPASRVVAECRKHAADLGTLERLGMHSHGNDQTSPDSNLPRWYPHQEERKVVSTRAPATPAYHLLQLLN